MTPEALTNKLRASFPEGIIHVNSDDHVHFDLKIETDKFRGLTKIQQHKMVMDLLQSELKSGEIHAVTLKLIAT